MKRCLTIVATTCIVGFGVWWGLFIVTTIHGLLAEANEPLFRTLSISSQICGVIAGVFWLVRRICRRAVTFPDIALFFVGAVSLSYLTYLAVSDELRGFLAFDPLAAAQRSATNYTEPAGELKFVGTTRMGVRVYAMKLSGGTEVVIGVAPRFRLWWIPAFNMPREAFDASEFDHPPKTGG